MGTQYNVAGTVVAVQWTGTNQAAVMAALGAGWDAWTSTASTSLGVVQAGNEWSLGQSLVPPGSWIVSIPSYGSDTPSFNNGFVIVADAAFTQQYASA